jgi:hypothetical protein
MQQPALAFSAPRSFTSRKAKDRIDQAGTRGEKVKRLLALYQAGSYADFEIAQITEWPRSSICSLRACLKDELVKAELIMGNYGHLVQRWTLTGKW